MKVVIQRVISASVNVNKNVIGQIENGLLILLGISVDDTQECIDRLVNKIVKLRIFADENNKMNCSVLDKNGGILIIPNFTLYADCKHGCRPSFTDSASSRDAESLYYDFVKKMKESGVKKIAQGKFGADMRVSLINDGPVTIVLDSDDLINKRR